MSFGHKLQDLTAPPEGAEGAVEARFSTPSGSLALGAQFLVGADGLHSRVRQRLLGELPPEFQGRVMWRGRLQLLAGSDIREWLCARDPENRKS